ncbi:MAG: ADP-forming succinate--CoA ligase subunit beta [Candidatus Omnitrophica bacterium]|nr:ADP-forming succinate--CoA ligase subunit beta [Candidatus Omnitrophota bacterium]
MNIHEYQAKELFRNYVIPVPDGAVASEPGEAESIAIRLGGSCVVKAQIHAGGRGKGGGIKLAKTPDEARLHAQTLLNKPLVTPQTGHRSSIVRKVLIEESCHIKNELYMGMVIDRSTSRASFLMSSEGGMEIEEVAAKHPDKIFKELIDPAIGLMPFQMRRLSFSLNLDKGLVNEFVKIGSNLYRLFVDKDCSLVEINPLVITEEGRIMALDAKINFDDNGLYRHPEIEKLRDVGEEDPLESEARKWGLSYVRLDGDIGCMVNGAGLAMATMDAIKIYGANPANFLDVGGGASLDQVTQGFKLILNDKKVRAILINIFGGIMKCDVIAQGIINAANEINIQVPLVVRLEGTNVEEGRRLLSASGLNIISAKGMNEAVEKVVKII